MPDALIPANADFYHVDLVITGDDRWSAIGIVRGSTCSVKTLH
jgi:hypothetical protein